MVFTVSGEPLPLLSTLLSWNLWIPFRREKVSEAQFFSPKRKRELPFDHRARGVRGRAPKVSAVEDLNDGNRSPRRMGGSRLSRRRYSSRWSRAVGQGDTRRRRARAPKAFERASKHGSLKSGQKRGDSPVGVPPLGGLWELHKAKRLAWPGPPAVSGIGRNPETSPLQRSVFLR
jgi:hypothetical protein